MAHLPFLLFSYSYPKQVADAVSNPELKDTATRFATSVNNVWDLMYLPYSLFTSGSYDAIFKSAAARALATESPTTQEHFKKLLDTIASETEKQRSEVVAAATTEILAHLNDKDTRPSMLLLIYAGLTQTWSAFECLCKDAWIDCLNARPLNLAPLTIQNVSDQPVVDGLNKRMIAVGILAKYGFDLHNAMGTVLAPKFDFTGIEGIRTAYKAAFPKSKDLHAVFDQGTLPVLEQFRHLIVHRGGIVDTEFNKALSYTMPLGQSLPINDEIFCGLVSSTIEAGCKLTQHLDTWLTANPPDLIMEISQPSP